MISCILVLVIASTLSAQVSFSGLDLSPTDELLFVATTDAPGFGSYRTLLHAELQGVGEEDSARAVAGGDVLRNASLSQLTFFPEIVTYLPSLRAVQIQNRFGLFRGSIDSGSFEPVVGFESFSSGASVRTGRVFPVTASPDGRYLVALEPTSAAYGDLVLIATDGSGRTTVATRVELSTEQTPARWSPDSRFFVYSRGGSIFYFSVEQFERGRLLGETFRELGPGTLSSVRWSDQGSLYYVSGSLVYEILGPEFFTRSLYAGLLQIGTIIGKLPFLFDPNFDSFHIGPDGETALLNKGGRNLFVLFLDPDDFVGEGEVRGLPSLFLPRNTRVRQVVWSAFGQVTILTGSIEQGASRSSVFRLNTQQTPRDLVFERMDERGVHEIRLSPDGERIALLTGEGVAFHDHTTWALERSVTVSEPVHAVWIDSERLVVGGRATVEIVSGPSGDRRVLTLAQPDEHSIGDDGTIVAR
ncbi:MAG: polysaccharide deacetylase family protein, partial [Spirochaetota bacterium]